MAIHRGFCIHSLLEIRQARDRAKRHATRRWAVMPEQPLVQGSFYFGHRVRRDHTENHRVFEGFDGGLYCVET
jgi:hypothetical protein